MTRDDDLSGRMPSHPMLTVFANIGEIKKGIDNLEEGQAETNKRISGLHAKIETLVTVEDCEASRLACQAQQAARAAAPAPVAVSASGSPGAPSRGLLERLGDNAKALTAILGLLALLGGALLVLSRFINRVEDSLGATTRTQQAQTQQVLEAIRAPQVIPLSFPQPVILPAADAGPLPRRSVIRRSRPRVDR